MSFTSNQQTAIDARGNTLVVAGAGAGKTGTLVERCIRLLLDGPEPVKVSKILVVTFTEAAAAEVRDRIRRKLEEAARLEPSKVEIHDQIARLDSAHISTLHSFCLALIREHFYELDLDPAVSVLPPEQAEMLFLETFDELLNEHFAGEHPFSAELQETMRNHFGGWDVRVRDLIKRLHHYTQTRPDPEGWLRREMELLNAAQPDHWMEWYRDALNDWCGWWEPYLASMQAENENAAYCAKLFRAARGSGEQDMDPGFLTAMIARKGIWPKGKKEKQEKAFGRFFEEAEFLESLRAPEALRQDWEWSAPVLRTVLQFAQQFAERYGTKKRERGAVDFHDLEQGALRLLWNSERGEPTAIARRWQQRFHAVFVDEYQDINAAQDLILTALSRGEEGGYGGNRFLVGDIKQSIYGFRQADPSIFRRYLSNGVGWTRAVLSDNFRSHEGILNFISPFFGWLMQEPVGGVAYDADGALRFGGAEQRPEMSAELGKRWPVEMHLLVAEKKGRNGGGEEFENGDELELENAEKEARLVAARLRELRDSECTIYHQKEKKARPVEWRDMVVLLRAAAGKLETYAKAFAAVGVPLQTKRDGFFTAQEVLDLCNVLTLLDNPLQDVPLVAVLRSPLVGMTANELAQVRIHAKQGCFWAAIQSYLEAKKQNEGSQKIQHFLTRFHQWRNPRQCFSLAQRLELILADTGYGDWLLGQPRGRQRHANVQQLLRVAQQFDDARGEGLYLFLRHIQELQEAAGDIEPASASEENAVRLMTVHQSKGLEFPVVAVADMGKLFNTTDHANPVLLHERYGICSTVKPPESLRRYSSLPHWLASREQRLNSVGEEMRVLYVALTRAENLLMLFGTTTENQVSGGWQAKAMARPFPQQLLRTRSWLDWMGIYANWQWPGDIQETAQEGQSALPFLLEIHRTIQRGNNQEQICGDQIEQLKEFSGLPELRRQISFHYPHSEALLEPAKTSVSSLRERSRSTHGENGDEEAAVFSRRFISPVTSSEARERGLASHTFLQHLELRSKLDLDGLRNQAKEMIAGGVLDKRAIDQIDFAAVAAFWNSEFGQEVMARAREVRRELPFTFKLGNEDLRRVALEETRPIPEGEFVLTQGVADLVVLGQEEIWLVDFKTDAIEACEIGGKTMIYRSQVELYALALERVYGKPVTRRGIYFLAAKALVMV